MKILITGVAGFIGFHTAKESLLRGDVVVGVDNVNDYYDTSLKEARLKELNSIEKASSADFTFIRGNIANKDVIEACFEKEPKRVINLAAQAGVRKSLEDPDSYIESNIVGFVNILEACRHHKVDHLTYASTSSVYGLNSKLPFSEREISDHPLQLYAATKRSNELLAHAYSNLFNLPHSNMFCCSIFFPTVSTYIIL